MADRKNSTDLADCKNSLDFENRIRDLCTRTYSSDSGEIVEWLDECDKLAQDRRRYSIQKAVSSSGARTVGEEFIERIIAEAREEAYEKFASLWEGGRIVEAFELAEKHRDFESRARGRTGEPENEADIPPKTQVQGKGFIPESKQPRIPGCNKSKWASTRVVKVLISVSRKFLYWAKTKMPKTKSGEQESVKDKTPKRKMPNKRV